MAYTKTNWKARQGTGLNKFRKSGETATVVYLDNAPDSITEPGVSFTPAVMNKMEQGIYDAHNDTVAEARLPSLVTTAGNATTGATQLAAGTYTIKAILQRLIHNIAKAFSDLSALSTRIDSVENLGDYAGSFDTYALLPKNKSGFTKVVTVNDWADIRTDENKNGAATRYIVSAINTSGVITWSYDITYSTDISGKTDKVAGATNGNFAGLDAAGNLKDSGKKAADFQSKVITATCATAANAAAKVVTIAGYTLTAGDMFAITFTSGNTADGATININGAGAKAVSLGGGAPAGTSGSGAHYIAAGRTAVYYYNGTYMCLMGSQDIADDYGGGGGALPASMIVTLTQDNKEGELASLYGGSWVKAINPAPRVLTGAYPGSAGTLNGTGTVSPGTVNLNIAATQGYTVTIQTCGVGPGVSVAIISSLDGTLQTIVGDSTGGSQKFNSVILRANETLSLKITGGNIGGYSVSWYLSVSKTEYIYFRI